MNEKIEAWKAHVRQVSADASFVHHEWFVKWHLEIVERIALELCKKYPAADRELVEVMVWLHDYGRSSWLITAPNMRTTGTGKTRCRKRGRLLQHGTTFCWSK